MTPDAVVASVELAVSVLAAVYVEVLGQASGCFGHGGGSGGTLSWQGCGVCGLRGEGRGQIGEGGGADAGVAGVRGDGGGLNSKSKGEEGRDQVQWPREGTAGRTGLRQ